MDQPNLSPLTSKDPPAVTIRNRNATGPGVVTVDHAANTVPLAWNRLGLPPTELQRHIAFDIGALGVAERIADRLSMPMVASGYSRMVIDLNRPPDDFTSIREIYDGAVIPGNRHLTEADRALRVATFFDPYHDAVAAALAQQDRRHRLSAMIAIHSFTPVYAGTHRPWEIGVLSNQDRRMADTVLETLSNLRPDLTIGNNKPYSGCDPYGYSIETHALPFGRPNVLFEIRQDLIKTGDGQARFGDLLADILIDIVEDPGLYTPYNTLVIE